MNEQALQFLASGGTTAAVLGLLIGYVYARAYRGLVLSASFVHTSVVTVPLVALLVYTIRIAASSEAQLAAPALAFALVGLLGLIRFRTVVRDTREFTFIFLAIVCGVGIGSDLWLATPVACLAILGMLVALERMQFGAPAAPSLRAKVLGKADALDDYLDALRSVATRIDFVAFSQATSESASYTFEFVAKLGQTPATIGAALRAISGTEELKIGRLNRSQRGDSDSS